jgi:hypothetical protein
MDNYLQIDEIKKYQRHLQQQTGEPVDEEVAALLWIRDYARDWRSKHYTSLNCA